MKRRNLENFKRNYKTEMLEREELRNDMQDKRRKLGGNVKRRKFVEMRKSKEGGNLGRKWRKVDSAQKEGRMWQIWINSMFMSEFRSNKSLKNSEYVEM